MKDWYENKAEWTPRFLGDAPPQWNPCMPWALSASAHNYRPETFNPIWDDRTYTVPAAALLPTNNLQSLLEQLKAHPKEELEAAGVTLAEPKTARDAIRDLLVEASFADRKSSRAALIQTERMGWGKILDHLAANLHKIPGFRGVSE